MHRLFRLASALTWAAAFVVSAGGPDAIAAKPVGPPIGPDVENYSPPFSGAKATKAWKKAYYGGDRINAERIARRMVASTETLRPGETLERVEALFILGLTVDEIRRHSEAETIFREGLSLLKPLMGSASDDPASHPRIARARDWARYFEIHLQENLVRQGRIRESNMLVSIIPRAEGGSEVVTSGAEVVGVGGMFGIATDLQTGTGPGATLTAAQRSARDALNAEAYRAARAQEKIAYRDALQRLLDFDTPVHGPDSLQIAYDLRRLADAEYDLERHEESLGLARRAVSIHERQSSPRPKEMIAALQSVSNAVEATGDARAAEAPLRRALDLQGRSVDPYLVLDLAANLFAQARLADAEAQYRIALQASGLDSITERQVRVFLGYLGIQQGNYAAGIKEYRGVCSDTAELAAQAARGSRASAGSMSARHESAECAVRQAIALWRWSELGGGAGAADVPASLRAEAFVAAQRAHPDPSAEALAHAAARAVAARSGVGALVEQYDTAIRERDAAGNAPPENWLETTYRPRTEDEERLSDRQNQRIAELATKLAAAAPRFWELRMPHPIGISALQATMGAEAKLLHDNEALVLFMIPPDSRYGLVFAVSKQRAAWARLGLSRSELQEKVTRIRSSIDGEAYGAGKSPGSPGLGALPFDRTLAHELYQELFGDPAIQGVLAAPTTWIIVPAGPLTSLPPSLLVTGAPEGGREGDDDDEALRRTPWLARSKAIAVLPSVAALRTIRQILPAERETARDPLLALVDPDFGAAPAVPAKPPQTRSFTAYFRDGQPDVSALRALGRLPNTRAEGLALMKILGAREAAVLWGASASKKNLLGLNASGALAQVRVLEFATHGLAAGKDDGIAEPLLVLAAADRPEDWILKASDAAGLKLNADWVVLSGCNTASPDLGQVDGLSGFARAFFFAGASSLLVSHWRLDDEIASSLVPETIRLHNSGARLSKAEALRQAMLAIIDDRERIAAHPAYWAPFTLVGETR
jgi:CHAT domain-containing protein